MTQTDAGFAFAGRTAPLCRVALLVSSRELPLAMLAARAACGRRARRPGSCAAQLPAGHHGPCRRRELHPGVAPYVGALYAAGIKTYESCEGGAGHSYPESAIRFYGERGEGFRALAVALQHGFPVRAVKRIWTIDRDGHPHGPEWE